MAKRLATSVTVNPAKVERWLLVVGVAPDGKNDASVSGGGRENRTSNLQDSLPEYCQKLEEASTRVARERPRLLTGDLFQSLHRTEEQEEAVGIARYADYSQALVEKRLTTLDDIEIAWAEVRTRRLRLWDRLKRV